MLLQIIWIAVVEVEVPHKRKLARPDIHLMLRVTQVISQTASKISGSKDQYFGDMGGSSMVGIHGEI